MTKDDIIRMARQAGLRRFGPLNIDPEIERFANLVAAAKCEELAIEAERNGNTILAQQIRARGQA